MTTRIIAAVAALAAISPFAAFSSDDVSEVSRADRRVEYRDCPKCDKRIRIDLAADKAYVNLSRLEGGGDWYRGMGASYGVPMDAGGDMCTRLCLANLLCSVCGPGAFCCI